MAFALTPEEQGRCPVMVRTNAAMLFIWAGLYLAFGSLVGFESVNAALLLCLGLVRYRLDRWKWALVLMLVSLLVLILNQFALFACMVLLSLGIYYLRSRPSLNGRYRNSHRLFLNLRLDDQTWLLKSMSIWQAFGEIRMDLSLAMPEEKETTIVLQGLCGDVDLTIPEHFGLQVEASVLVGQIGFGQFRDGGVLQQYAWRSPDYDQREFKVKLQLFYLVGDIKIRTE
jgi:lia operon protein LiaF